MKGISVIIPAHNAASRISQTLRHLAAQQVPDDLPWEIILIDNNSSDGTAEIARREWNEFGNPAALHTIEEKRPGVTVARQRGFKAAKYDLLITCDDDNWLAPDYFAKASEIMSARPDIGTLVGMPVAVADSELPSWFDEYALPLTCAPRAAESGDLSDSKWAAGAGMVMRTETLRNLMAAGFSQLSPGRTGDQTIPGEDAELCLWHLLVGQKIWYDDSLVFKHYIEPRKLQKGYVFKLVEDLKKSPEYTMPYTYVLWGKDYSQAGIMKKIKVAAKLLLKPLFGKNIQAEAVAFLPVTRPLLDESTRTILKSVERFWEITGKQTAE